MPEKLRLLNLRVVYQPEWRCVDEAEVVQYIDLQLAESSIRADRMPDKLAKAIRVFVEAIVWARDEE